MFGMNTTVDKKIEEFLLTNKEKMNVYFKNGVECAQQGSLSFLECIAGITNKDNENNLFCYRAENQGGRRDVNWSEQTDLVQGYFNLLKIFFLSVNNADHSNQTLNYSKALATPLFKYHKNSYIYASLLPLNKVTVEVSIFQNNAQDIHCTLQIPFKKLLSAQNWEMAITNYLNEKYSMSEVENIIKQMVDIDFKMEGFCLDTCFMDRGDWDRFCDNLGIKRFKRVCSFRSDMEVVATQKDQQYVLKNPDAIQMFRFLYYLILDRKNPVEKGVNIIPEICKSYINDLRAGRYDDIIEIEEEQIDSLENFVRIVYITREFESNAYEEQFNRSNCDDTYLTPACCWWAYKGAEDILERSSTCEIYFKNTKLHTRMLEQLKKLRND